MFRKLSKFLDFPRISGEKLRIFPPILGKLRVKVAFGKFWDYTTGLTSLQTSEEASWNAKKYDTIKR